MLRFVTLACLIGLSATLAGCGGKPMVAHGNDDDIPNIEMVDPGDAPSTPQTPTPTRKTSHLKWMSQPSREVQKSLDRLLRCPTGEGRSAHRACEIQNTGVNVEPHDDSPVEHMDAWIIDGELHHDKIRPLPVAGFPFRAIDYLFPNWPDRQRWLRKAIVEANHRPCPAAIKVDGVWIIVEGEYIALYRYRAVDLYIETTDEGGLRAERCWESRRAERQ
jgi:hypothetical protein